MHYIIHRGQHEIGGICIEVSAEDGTRILLDLGMPLVTEDGGEYPFDTPQRSTAELLQQGVLRPVQGLYEGAEPPEISAIILTHGHLDHWGLVHHAHRDIPVYGSDGTAAIIDIGRVFFPDSARPERILPLPDEGPTIGSMRVTAIPVDHAAPDSRALLVEADGQRLLYTGDFRAHGRMGFRYDRMLEDERLRDVDWLLIEGTTLGASASGHGLQSESDVEESLVELMGEHPDDMLVVVASGQNVDRLVSCFRAARRSGRQLVIDPYQAYVLHRLATLSKNIPQFDWRDVRISFAPHQVDRLLAAGLDELVYRMGREAKVGSDELAATPSRFLLCARGSYGVTKLFNKIGADRIQLAWSMWEGYWNRDRSPVREWAARTGCSTHFVHSGGHAWPEDLARLVDALQPKETVWVHTDCVEEPTHA